MRAGQLDEMDLGERCDHCGEVAVHEVKEFVVRDVSGGDDQEASRYAAEKVRVSEIPVLRDDGTMFSSAVRAISTSVVRLPSESCEESIESWPAAVSA